MDTISAESRDRLRQAIDEKINSSEESTRVLKSRRNALALISCLPPETLAAIFSFLLPEWNKEARYLEWIRVAHVCHRWRETALNHPRFWSHINFTKLTPAAVVEILARAKMAPLHLEADSTKWGWVRPQVDAIDEQLEAHISHTQRLRIRGALRSTLERLVSSAPALEFLSLSHESGSSSRVVIPVNLFNLTTPSLTSLELKNCDISWKSPLLEGLRTLEIVGLSTEARPKLEDWLVTLGKIPQLETLVLESATPLASLAPLTSHTSRIITLPSLTKFHISGSAKVCSLALAHLAMPTLTWLHVDAKSQDYEGGEDVQQLIPYVAQNVYGLQDSEPFRSILIDGKGVRVEVRAWTAPDADLMFCDPDVLVRATVPARFKFAATCSNWHGGVDAAILDAFLTHFPDSVSTLTTRNNAELTKAFWVRHAPRWSLLKRASLVPATIKGFRDMLAEDAPSDGPRLPELTKLILDEITLTAPRANDLRDMLLERVEQGVPLKVLDLRTCFATEHAIQLLKGTVVDIQEPLNDPMDESQAWRLIEQAIGDWHVQGSWGDSDEDEDEDENGYPSPGEMDYYDDGNYDNEIDYW